jgi:bacteriocin biosynthesis cyclodehydratase domain-containing protein
VDDVRRFSNRMTRCLHGEPEVAVRPVVKTALRRLWRDATTLQIGIHHERAIVVGGVGEQTARLIAALDGAHDAASLRVAARGLGLDEALVGRLLSMLADAAVLDDAAIDTAPLAALPLADRDRLAPDLASISLVSGALDGGQSVLARRQRASVRLLGGGRVGGATAALLAAAGIGHLVVEDPATCRPADCGPAGPALADAGASRAQAAHAAVHRVSTSTRTAAAPPEQRFDVVVLANPASLDPQLADELVRSGDPHIVVAVREATAVIGPFVIPGVSACLRCLELHRSDRDPAWPLIAAQLAADGRRSWVEACDVTLATLAASVCTLQVLTFIDGSEPAALDGTLEIALPDWRIRRRSWAPHPACGCCWPGRLAGVDDAVAAAARLNAVDA